MIRAVSVEPVNATPAMRGSATAAAPTTAPSPGRKCSTPAGTPACSSRRTACAATSGVCSAGFAMHRVAGRQRGSHLPREDREREIPRADAREHAAAVQAQLVALARGPGQAQRAAELRARPCRVVAQEIDRLAHLGDAVRNGLARLAHAHRDQLGRVLLEQVGGPVERCGADVGRRGVPGGLRRHRDVDRLRRPAAASPATTVPTMSP